MNKNESARNYIQFSSCDCLQNMEFCRDELYKMSRQRWCDELGSGDTFLSICQLLQLDRGNNHLEHHHCRSVDVLVLVLHSHQNRPAQNTCKRIHIHASIQAPTTKASSHNSFKKKESLQKKEITQCMLTSPDQAPTHHPHTHSGDSSTFTDA